MLGPVFCLKNSLLAKFKSVVGNQDHRINLASVHTCTQISTPLQKSLSTLILVNGLAL